MYCKCTQNIVFVIMRVFIQITVNIKSSTNTENNNTSDAFADFDAITSGLLGNADLKGTSFDVKAQQTQFFHQSQHSNKQRYENNVN